MRIHCAERMYLALADLEAHAVDQTLGFEFDVREECSDEWTRDYAIALVEIIEPDDEMRDVFDLHAAIKKVVGIVAGHFGKTFVIARKPVGNAAGQFLGVHRIGAGWGVEIEAYRQARKINE